MRPHDDERTTESRQPTLRALPMVELREARASDVQAGGARLDRRRAEPRPSTVPLPKPGARWEAAPPRAALVTPPHARSGPAKASAPMPSHARVATLTPPLARDAAPLARAPTSARAAPSAPTSPATPRAGYELAGAAPGFVRPATPGFAAGRLAIADAATELHAPPLDDTPIVAIPPELAAPRAWGDPASLAPPPWGMAPHGAPTSTATAHPAAHSAARPDPGPTVPIVEVHAPVLRFGPIEKGILILAGFSIVAVIISTIFHSI